MFTVQMFIFRCLEISTEQQKATVTKRLEILLDGFRVQRFGSFLKKLILVSSKDALNWSKVTVEIFIKFQINAVRLNSLFFNEITASQKQITF